MILVISCLFVIIDFSVFSGFIYFKRLLIFNTIIYDAVACILFETITKYHLNSCMSCTVV